MDELFPYQEYGADWLSKKRFALLADEMRVGKSPQSITACDKVNAQNITVLCPATARVNWAKEFGKWSVFSPSATTIFSGSDRPKTSGLNICSYDLTIQSDMQKALYTLEPDVLILDESHGLKSLEAQRTHAVWGLHGLARRAKRVWCLTGTPMPNGNPSELWVMLHSFGVYPGKYDSFVRRFCTGYFDGQDFHPTGSKNEDALQKLLDQVMLRRTMAEVRPELPGTMYENVVIESEGLPVDDKIWDDHVRTVLENAPEDQHELILKDLANQSIATLRRHTGISKVAGFANLIREEMAAKPRKMVIFAYHTEVLASLKHALGIFNPVMLWGGTPGKDRQGVIDKFTENKSTLIFLGQIQAAKENIDLSVASDIFFCESSWLPGDNSQASKRCGNVKKDEPVIVRFVSMANSYDEVLNRALVRKMNTIEKILG